MISAAGWPLWAVGILFICGLVLIVKGGDLFVDSAVWIAEVSGIPKFIIGATVVSFATTLPELLVSAIGAARGSNAIAIGNAVGSVTANTGLIMAVSIICIPAAVSRKTYSVKSVLLLAATVILFAASACGRFPVWGSSLLLGIFAASVYESVTSAKAAAGATDKAEIEKGSIPANILKFIIGAAGIVIGADFLVSSATEGAAALGVSEAVISATVVAVGTSLPELVTTVTAIVKRQSPLSVGNIIGANLIDIAVILPVCSFISGQKLYSCPQNVFLDLPVCLAVLIIAIIPMLIKGRFYRVQGAALLAVYLSYVIFISFFNPF